MASKTKRAPKTSLRPVSKEEALVPRRSSEAMGDVEFRYDLDPQLSWNPLARLGYDPEKAKVTKVAKDSSYIAQRHPEGWSQKDLDAYLTQGGRPDLVGKVKPGDILVSSTVAKSPVYSHEFTHGGLAKVVEYYKEDPEAFKQAYGEEAASMIEGVANNPDSNEATTEMMDDINATMTGAVSNMKETQTELGGVYNRMLAEKLAKKLKKERASEMGKINTAGSTYGGMQGILIAAEDLLKEKGEPPLAKHMPPSFFQRTLKKLGFAEGGAVMPEEEQMNAVFKSSRVDPVSGNEVPPGAMPEEVRDDVPAMLSEGEYVVPADVLRYYGVRFFEELREKAKAEMGHMEATGRTGKPIEEEDDDMPFSMEELNVIEEPDMPMEEGMNKGGYVKGYADGGDVTKMEVPDFLKGVSTPATNAAPTQEYKTFKNDAGLTMTVRFVNGKPTAYIPPGYTEVSATDTVKATDTTTTETKVEEEKGSGGENVSAGMENMSTEALQSQLDSLQSGKGLAATVSKIADRSILGLMSKALTGKTITQNNMEAIYGEIATREGKTTQTQMPNGKMQDVQFFTGDKTSAGLAKAAAMTDAQKAAGQAYADKGDARADNWEGGGKDISQADKDASKAVQEGKANAAGAAGKSVSISSDAYSGKGYTSGRATGGLVTKRTYKKKK